MQIKQLVFQTAKKTRLPSIELELILAFVLKKSTPLETRNKKTSKGDESFLSSFKRKHISGQSSFLTGSREFLFTHPEYELTKKQISNFKFQISKRLKSWPLAYLTGHKEFYGLDFIVNKNVLIPGPETELMVDEAIKLVSRIAYPKSPAAEVEPPIGGSTSFCLIDVGTGSGNIIISLAKLIKKLSSEYSELSFNFYGVDISKKALAVARKNAKLHKVNNKIKFLHGNLLKPILKIKSTIDNRHSKILILANLPYLTLRQIKQSPTIKHEPRLALNGGRDGLKYYKRLLRQVGIIRDSLKFVHNSCISVLLEIDPSQTQKIITLIKNQLPTATYEIKKDLCGRNRLVIMNLKIS